MLAAFGSLTLGLGVKRETSAGTRKLNKYIGGPGLMWFPRGLVVAIPDSQEQLCQVQAFTKVPPAEWKQDRYILIWELLGSMEHVVIRMYHRLNKNATEDSRGNAGISNKPSRGFQTIDPMIRQDWSSWVRHQGNHNLPK